MTTVNKALQTANPTTVGNTYVWNGAAGTNQNDIMIQTGDVSRFDEFMVYTPSAGGGFQVIVSIDGVNWVTAPLSLIDLGAAATTPVLSGVSARAYAFYGMYAFIQVQQNGATATTGAVLVASKKGGQF